MPTAVTGLGFHRPLLFILQHDILKTDEAKIIKLDNMQMIYN